ncbi:MAG: cell division protein FtsZ, partial [Thermodesulfobacteriota bacterium]|nr:cell division protein FtsZ [Thermodesulfobacteriota bacterium]
ASEDANIIFGTVIDDSMEDEIRITVIATGFDPKGRNYERAPELSTVPGYATKRREDLAKPTFIRNRDEKTGEKPVVVRMGMINDDDNPDFETPAFLRKQMD